MRTFLDFSCKWKPAVSCTFNPSHTRRCLGEPGRRASRMRQVSTVNQIPPLQPAGRGAELYTLKVHCINKFLFQDAQKNPEQETGKKLFKALTQQCSSAYFSALSHVFISLFLTYTDSVLRNKTYVTYHLFLNNQVFTD